MKAVHFGAGNIGRGFVGPLLREGGFEIVFADVAADLISALAEADAYTVHTVGEDPRDHVIDGFRALNSAEDPEALSAEIASADAVTTAVGVGILGLVAPAIAAGLAARPAAGPRVAVMACENAINATDVLEAEVRKRYPGDDLDAKALFANTAVDRIVPGQAPGAGLDVTVEEFYEWAVERGPFRGEEPNLPGVTWVDDLEPYIERKLFTVNTGHAATAWHGWAAGHVRIADAAADPSVRAKVEAALDETSALMVVKHGFAPAVQRDYEAKTLVRFGNRALPDTVERVGRAPLRKLSRHDRIIGPAAELAERRMGCDGLLQAFSAALAFVPAGDEEAARLQTLLREKDARAVSAEITGLDPTHPLFAPARAVVAARQSAL